MKDFGSLNLFWNVFVELQKGDDVKDVVGMKGGDVDFELRI